MPSGFSGDENVEPYSRVQLFGKVTAYITKINVEFLCKNILKTVN